MPVNLITSCFCSIKRWDTNDLNTLNFYYYSPFANSLTSIRPYAPRQFWDSDTYALENPVPSTNNTQGLSEYTNANFVSDDTVFSANFPYPSRVHMQYYEQPTGTTWMGMPLYRKYYRKTGGGEQIEHFAYLGRFYKFLDSTPILQTVTIGLDDACYKDYAQKLIPRAVGYSAGLLNYFLIDKKSDSFTQGEV